MDSGRRRRKENEGRRKTKGISGAFRRRRAEKNEISWLQLLDIRRVLDQLSMRCPSLSAPLADVSVKVRLPMGLFVPFQTFPIDQCCTRGT